MRASVTNESDQALSEGETDPSPATGYLGSDPTGTTCSRPLGPDVLSLRRFALAIEIPQGIA